jgi:hypothetical protein
MGGMFAGLVGHGVGNIIANINIHSSTADVVLTIDDVRTGEEGPITTGHGSKTDLGFGGAGGWGNWSGFGGASVSSYQNTDIGQVVALAYIDAYAKMVDEMGGLPAAYGSSASEEAPMQAVTLTRAANLYETSEARHVVRPLSKGMMLYPTGDKEGKMWKVKDELGNEGWVSSMAFELSK